MPTDADDSPPPASAAAWSATAAPRPAAPVLNLGSELGAPADPATPAALEPESEPAAPAVDRLASLRDVARRLRSAPDAEETLQFVIDTACAATASDAGMLTVNQPDARQVVHGSALGAGPYISVQLRAGGPTFGEMVLTRMADAPEFSPHDQTYVDLVAEYVAKGVAGLRRGTVLSDEQQDFIDRITEELRAPMAGAVALLDTVLGGHAGHLGDQQATYLRAVRADSGRLLTLVDDLLAIAHLRPPELRELQPVPVGPWLRRCVEEHRPAAEAKGVEVVLAEPAEPWLVKGVPSQLDNVMRQVLSNAVKFTDTGGKVDVSLMLAEGLLRITVADTGMGFDQSDANRMLDCFSRAVNADAARIPGIGMGLFLAAEIVKNHSGRLWLESRRDEGTQAHVGLPPADPGA